MRARLLVHRAGTRVGWVGLTGGEMGPGPGCKGLGPEWGWVGLTGGEMGPGPGCEGLGPEWGGG